MTKTLRQTRVLPLLFAAVISTSVNAGGITALVGARIIDGIANKPLKQNVILVEGERIVAVGDESDIPDGATIVKLPGATLLPGMIDGLNHPMETDDYQTHHLQHSSAYKTLKGYMAMQKTLAAGWTTILVGGDSDVYHGNQDIKRLMDEGVLTGPRIFGAAHYLTITGGGGDINYYSPEQNIIPDGLVVDGPEEIRKAIRNEAKYGSDWVKVLVTGAYMSVGDDPNSVQFSTEELQAVMDEAGRQGMRVMAHAHAADGIKMAVRMGAQAIAHGSFMDDEAIELMRKHGTFLVPTLYVGDYYNDPRYTLREQDRNDYYMKHERDILFAWVGKAHRAGVKVVTGVDLGGYNFDPTVYAREMAMLIEAGLSPMDAIKSATSVAAAMLDQTEALGAIQVGHFADIIAVGADPLGDIGELERVKFVMSNGAIIKNETAR